MSGTKSLPRILIIFNTVSLYGMERGVIETFDLLRAHATPHFLMSYTTHRLNLPVLAEVKSRNLSHSFFSDTTDWPSVSKPKSLRHTWQMIKALVKGNLDALKQARHHDILYLPSYAYFYFAFLAALYFRLSRKRIIYHFHDLVAAYSTALRITTFFVTDFIHNAKSSYETVIQTNPDIRTKRNYIIPYPISQREHINEDESVKKAFEGKRNILFVGQVAKHKGVDLLIEAFKLASESNNNVALHIIGGCDDENLKDELKRPYINNGCQIKYWGYRDDVLHLMKMADVYVHPSPPSLFNESFGRGVVEAMLQGVPAIGFQSGALPEIIEDNHTGLICKVESSVCLRDAIHRFLNEPAFRNNCGKRARERYEKNYSNEYIKPLWLEVIEQR